MELLQIYDRNGDEFCLVTTDFTEEDFHAALLLDPEDIHGLDAMDKFSKYANDIGKTCQRFYIDGSVQLMELEE